MDPNFPQPVYIPENTVELDASLLRIHNTGKFVNKDLQKVLTDDLVRSYLNDLEIKALWHYVACYENLCDASTGKYEGIYDNAKEIVLVDIMVLINSARSRSGINVRVMKGRNPLEELKKPSFLDNNRPFQNNQNNQQDIPQQNQNNQQYNQGVR